MSETTHDAATVVPDVHGDGVPAPEPGAAGHAPDGHAEHGEDAGPLGPIDWAAWGAGLLGVAAGLAVAACLYLATALPA